jgi:carbamoyl-phosphate synthase large subunit
MNILFTCAGRRNYLIQYFKETLGSGGKTIAVDMNISAPALAVADRAHVVPDVYADNYIETVLAICKKEEVSALISLNDLELPVLASARQAFDEIGVRLIVSKEEVIDTCFDKYETIRFCDKINVRCPKTYLDLDQAIQALEAGQLKFPLVVKPRWGSASVGIEFPTNMEELKLAFQLALSKISHSILAEASKQDQEHSVLIQEKINGTEYGLDILNDFSGRTVQVYTKEKLAMRAGETDKSVLRYRPELEEIGFKVGQALGHIANVDCDIFEKDGKYYLLEINPRFGGGYPFSHMSGANYPEAIYAWIEGREYDFSAFRRIFDIPYAKCDTLIKVLQ